VILFQELITGKGVIEGLKDGDFANFVFLGGFLVSVVGLTIYLAAVGEESTIDCEEPAGFETPEGWYDNL